MARLSEEAVQAGLWAARRILAGKRPTDEEIAASPRLSAWDIEAVGVGLYRLVGLVSGHPSIPDGPCFTSVVLVIDEDRKWARTISRVYALGSSIHEMVDGTDHADRS